MAWSRQELGRLEQYNANAKKDFQIQGYVGYPVNFQSIHLESIRGPPTMPCTMETEVSRATRNMWFPRQYILNGPWDSKWLWGRATLTIVVTKGISVQRTGEWGQIEIIWKKYVPGRWNNKCDWWAERKAGWLEQKKKLEQKLSLPSSCPLTVIQNSGNSLLTCSSLLKGLFLPAGGHWRHMQDMPKPLDSALKQWWMGSG